MSAVKRPVNLSLSEGLVKEARTMTDNLSGVVESLLTEFVAQEAAKRTAQDQALKQTIASWNTFAEQHGSFADEHSTL
jgi:antitoxin CcdA